MRQITKDITLKQGGQDLSFCLSRLDAFSGVSLLRLLMRLEDREGEHTILDLVVSHPVPLPGVSSPGSDSPISRIRRTGRCFRNRSRVRMP